MHIHISARGQGSTPGHLCSVIEDQSQRVYYSTPALVALALLQQYSTPAAVEVADAANPSLRWVDALSTHALAVGHDSQQQLTLLYQPPTAYEIAYQRATRTAREDATATVTFPPLLAMCRKVNGVYVNGSLWCVNPAAMATAGVGSTAACLRAFPYGNVYERGAICWGNVATRDIVGAADMLRIFMTSGFNTDLFAGSYLLPDGASSFAAIITWALASGRGGVLPAPTSWAISMHAAIRALVGRDA